MPSVPARSSAAWLPADTDPLILAIVKRALIDVGICEIPPGSNRSGRIDEYVTAVGSPVGSFWCAAALAAWYREAGAQTPPLEGASCDRWMQWARGNGSWRTTPSPGAAVIYGKGDDAQHIGVVVRTGPLLLSVEGNAAFHEYSPNGLAVLLRLVAVDRVLGYIQPLSA